jgi:hypothetical protein
MRTSARDLPTIVIYEYTPFQPARQSMRGLVRFSALARTHPRRATDLRTYLVGQITSLVVVALAIPTPPQGLRLVVFRDDPCRTTTKLLQVKCR